MFLLKCEGFYQVWLSVGKVVDAVISLIWSSEIHLFESISVYWDVGSTGSIRQTL